jgi:hypothetical protein
MSNVRCVRGRHQPTAVGGGRKRGDDGSAHGHLRLEARRPFLPSPCTYGTPPSRAPVPKFRPPPSGCIRRQNGPRGGPSSFSRRDDTSLLPPGRGMTYFYFRSLTLQMRREPYYKKPREPSGLLRLTPSPSRTRPKFLTLERRRLGERRASNARKCQKGALFSSS